MTELKTAKWGVFRRSQKGARLVWLRFRRTRSGRFAIDTAAALKSVASTFRGESITLRAGNLTFITITSLLPLLAVVLAALHWLNARSFELKVKALVAGLLAPGQPQQQVEVFAQQFFAAASSRALGGLSFFVLLFSAGILLRHLDASLNEIWAVRRSRPVLVSIALYTGLLLFGPLVVGVTLVGTANLRRLVIWAHLPLGSQVLVLGGILASVFAMTLLFKLAPHAPVRWRSALAGGFVTGIGWELARNTYGAIASLFFSANPVYGSLGIAPLFLMWLYVSWVIVLVGARLSYAVEYASFRAQFVDLLSHPRSLELIAARIAQLVAKSFREGLASPTAQVCAEQLKVPQQAVEEIVAQLEAAALLTTGKRGELKPAKDLSLLTLADVSVAVGGVASLLSSRGGASRSPQYAEFERLFALGDDRSVEHLREISWEQLAQAPEG